MKRELFGHLDVQEEKQEVEITLQWSEQTLSSRIKLMQLNPNKATQ